MTYLLAFIAILVIVVAAMAIAFYIAAVGDWL